MSEKKVARKKKAIKRKSKMIDNALNEYSSGKKGARAVKDANRKLKAIYKKQAKIKKPKQSEENKKGKKKYSKGEYMIRG